MKTYAEEFNEYFEEDYDDWLQKIDLLKNQEQPELEKEIIVTIIGLISSETRMISNEFFRNKVELYQKRNADLKKMVLEELQNAKELFYDKNKEVFQMIVTELMNKRSAMSDHCIKFIDCISEDIDQLHQKLDELFKVNIDIDNTISKNNFYITLFSTILQVKFSYLKGMDEISKKSEHHCSEIDVEQEKHKKEYQAMLDKYLNKV